MKTPQEKLEINLGQAKNQALEFLCAQKSPTLSLEKDYKEKVRLFFKMNCELDDELLNFQEAKKTEPVKVQQPKQEKPISDNRHMPKMRRIFYNGSWIGIKSTG